MSGSERLNPLINSIHESGNPRLWAINPLAILFSEKRERHFYGNSSSQSARTVASLVSPFFQIRLKENRYFTKKILTTDRFILFRVILSRNFEITCRLS